MIIYVFFLEPFLFKKKNVGSATIMHATIVMMRRIVVSLSQPEDSVLAEGVGVREEDTVGHAEGLNELGKSEIDGLGVLDGEKDSEEEGKGVTNIDVDAV